MFITCYSKETMIYNYIKNKIKFGCKCYMCVDESSATCIEVSIFYIIGGMWKTNLIEKEIEKIKKQIKKDNYRIFIIYMLCLLKFNKLFQTIIEKRYRPNGEGYIETKRNFEKNIFYQFSL